MAVSAEAGPQCSSRRVLRQRESGLSYADGKIFLSQLDGYLVALDAATGREVWKVQNADPKVGATMTSAPHVMKDKVIAGVSGGEFGVRGHVTAYDIKTGQEVWRAYSMGPDEDVRLADDFNAANPHFGRQNQGVATAGRSVENRRRHDVGLVRVRSVAEPHVLRHRESVDLEPHPAARRQQMVDDDLREGRRYGKAKWGYQMTPWDAWDYDGVNEMILADLTIGVNPSRPSSTSIATASPTRSTEPTAPCSSPKSLTRT